VVWPWCGRRVKARVRPDLRIGRRRSGCVDNDLSGARSRPGKGNLYLKGGLGEAAAAAAKTDTFLGERYRRIVKRRGKLKALAAVARSSLVIVWHLLSDPAATFQELGAGYYASRTDKDEKARNHIRQLEALGFTVTLAQAA
jgi:transposase